jgi:hypothetical protein
MALTLVRHRFSVGEHVDVAALPGLMLAVDDIL